jgi:quinoprotein glucose dehydrogenase
MTQDQDRGLRRPRPPYVFATLLGAIAALLIAGGLRLVLLGGSPYFLIAGLVQVGSAVLLWQRNVWGAGLYAGMLLGTLVWALWEVGLTPWPLASRLAMPAGLGLWLLLPYARRGLTLDNPSNAATFAGVAALTCFACIGLAFIHAQWTPFSGPLPPPNPTLAAAADDWPHYGNTLRGTRFSALQQITAANVSSLRVAWIYRSGETPNPFSSTEATPIKIDDTLYTCTPTNTVIALDAVTGKPRWRHEAHNEESTYPIRTCRGVAYYRAPTSDVECPTRIIAATLDARLLALDANTGKPCNSFGHNGSVSLHDGMGPAERYYQYTTSAVTIVSGHVVLGALVFDNQSTDMPSGVIRSFDPLTGELQWAWDMGAPERIGAPPAGDTYTRSTPNSWTIFTADEQLGLVYVPTGDASPDFWGAKRRSFDEKYATSIVALDVATGRPRWSFQTVHHDLWDYDISSQPTLVDLPTPSGPRAALIQATKRGDIYVLDRRDGTPIVPVHERPVPQGASPGDWVAKTQPFSELALESPVLTEASMWGATPLDQLVCRIKFRQSRYEGIFTPPGLEYTVIMPGLTGAVNWGGVSMDLDHNLLVANYMMLPWRGRLVPRAQEPKDAASSPFANRMRGTPFAWEQTPWLGPLAVPCSQPPWGALAAIDLSTRRVLWSQALGTGHDSGPLDIPSMLPFTMGVPSMGGTLTTRGGLVFISGTLDRYLRAFELRTGRELWKARLPAGAQATPLTYMAGGRQFLVVTAGGHSIMGTKFGDYTIAYALPKS